MCYSEDFSPTLLPYGFVDCLAGFMMCIYLQDTFRHESMTRHVAVFVGIVWALYDFRQVYYFFCVFSVYVCVCVSAYAIKIGRITIIPLDK